MFFERVQRRDQRTLREIIRRRVAVGSTVFTDCWGGYNDIDQPFDAVSGIGCDMAAHRTVNHSIEFVRHENIPHPDAGSVIHFRITTNHIERLWKEVKKRKMREKLCHWQ